MTIKEKNKKQIYEDSVKAAKKINALYIQDIFEYIGVPKSSFYDHFPHGSEELDYLKTIIRANKSNMRTGLRDKMYNSKSAAAFIGLLKIVGTEEEKKALNNTIDIQGISSNDIEKMAHSMRSGVTYKDIDKE